MALDRQSIEKRDFPVGRRGYDTAAVDEHLSRIADEVEALRGAESLAGTASERVRMIVDAAEQSAADIRGEAERARTEARERAKQLSEISAGLLIRVEALQGELLATIERLRETAEVGPEPPAAQPGAAPEPAEAAPEPAPPADEPFETDDEEPPASERGKEPDEEGARLIALNMALSGAPREETEQYLQENFQVADPQRLLDDIYARAGR